MLFPVVRVPKLRSDPELLPSANTLGNCLFDALAAFNLIAIVLCTIQMPVTHFDCFIDSIFHHAFVRLPTTKANELHIWKLRWSRHGYLEFFAVAYKFGRATIAHLLEPC